MPFAPKIRKQMLSALNEHIIPALQNHVITQVLAGPPFDFSGVEHWTEQKVLLQDKKHNALDVLVHWKKAGISARRMSQLAFLYGGASEERVGVTREMARQLKHDGLHVLPGITGFRLIAPAVFYVPYLVPHSGSPKNEILLQQYGPLRILVLQFTDKELLLRHFETTTGATHHLNITDPIFNQLEQEYVKTLAEKHFQTAQVQLINLAQKLSLYLTRHPAPISNSSWPPIHNKLLFVNSNASPKDITRCNKTIDYIQFHLHTQMTKNDLAAVSGVTYVHLNRIFQTVIGMTLMRYVTDCRLRAAKLMLSKGNERISDIANLVGFSSLPSFSVVFARHEGISPSEYRRKYTAKRK
jgi:AraC-like DNA-binding protein